MLFLRSDTFYRLLMMVAVATIPAILVLIYLQIEFNRGQRRGLNEEALVQADLVNGDMASIVEGARQLTLALTGYPQVQAFDPSCRVALTNLDRMLDSYELISVVDEDGAVICSSVATETGTVSPLQREQNTGAIARGTFETGVLRPATDGTGPLLMFSQPFTGEGGRRGVIDVGLSLKWLNAHFELFKRPPGSFISITDRNGSILVQVPNGEGQIGQPMTGELSAAVNAQERGNAVVRGENDDDRLVGYISANLPPIGLFSAVGLFLPELSGQTNDTARWAYGLMALATLVSVSLSMIMGRRFVRGPTNALLAAAGKWSAGHLDARVTMPNAAGSDFKRIAQAFNDMAEVLGRERRDREDLHASLEARVAERTADLLTSRDRLQVAMGEQAKSEALLRQAQKLQAVGQLAGGIAHDFNNLLTAVIGALELLRRRVAADDTRSLRLMDTALHAADRGGKLTSQLLAFSRRQRLLPVPTDLNQIVTSMQDLLGTMLGQDVLIEMDLSDTLWLALVDPHQVESAILNLAINARDAMAEGGTLRISTTNIIIDAGRRPMIAAPPMDGAGLETLAISEPAASGDYVMIRVGDTGSGMPQEVLARVFEPFFTTKQPGRGSGLGLSQVHGLAAQSRGELHVESELGHGTIVSLLLPRAMARVDTAAALGRYTRAAQMTLRVLVADDDPDVLRLTGEMLGELGHSPLLAHDAPSALRVLRSERGIDILLADHAMPGMTGTVLIDFAVEQWPAMRAILVTGHADVDAPNLVSGHPVLRKPFTLAVLAGAIDAVLERREGQSHQ